MGNHLSENVPRSSRKRWLRRAASFPAQAVVGNWVGGLLAALSAGIAVLIGLASTLFTDLSTTKTVVLFIGVVLVAYGVAGIAFNALVPESWLVERRRIDHAAERARQSEAHSAWQMRSTVRTISAEIAGNRRSLEDAVADRYYGWSSADHQLDNEAWSLLGSNLAGIEGGHEAHRLASVAYHDFSRINLIVSQQDNQPTFVMPQHRADRAISEAHQAEWALKEFAGELEKIAEAT